MRARLACPPLRLACAATLARLMLLLLLVARAFVPVGYMPDAQALKQGRLALGFCAAGGGAFPGMPGLAAPPAHADAPHGRHGPDGLHDHAGHHDPAGHLGAGQECPYGLSAHQALDLPPAVALAPVLLRWFVQAPRVADSPRPPMPAAGPPLGQRAPPRFTG